MSTVILPNLFGCIVVHGASTIAKACSNHILFGHENSFFSYNMMIYVVTIGYTNMDIFSICSKV